MKNADLEIKDSFVPIGAIAFFVALAIFFALVWFGFYGLLILRQNG